MTHVDPIQGSHEHTPLAETLEAKEAMVNAAECEHSTSWGVFFGHLANRPLGAKFPYLAQRRTHPGSRK